MLTLGQINFLNRVCPRRWTEENGMINVDGSVSVPAENLTQIPIQFGKIEEYFECSFNQLTNLINTPLIIGNYFSCENNQLSTLEGGPKKVGATYSCSDNKLTNLLGAVKICNGHFLCERNQLTSLEGCPSIIKGNLYCLDNHNLHILYGIGKITNTVLYNNKNDLNEWIISRARENIFSTYENIAEWIKSNNKHKYLLRAQKEIRQYFSPRILHLVDMGIYHNNNESKILDYNNFKKLC